MTGMPASDCCGAGLLGGTFDPVHAGHIAIAGQALEQLRLARLDFLLAPRPWQKTVITSVHHRAEMLRLALGEEPRMTLNLCETRRSGPTYTIDTLRDLRDKHPETPLILLMGFDQWTNLTTWKDWRSLTDYASIAIFNRGSAAAVPAVLQSWSENRIVAPNRITEALCGKISFFHMPQHEANSTEIRRMLAQRDRSEYSAKLKEWLSPKVFRYIQLHGLYRPQ